MTAPKPSGNYLLGAMIVMGCLFGLMMWLLWRLPYIIEYFCPLPR